MGKQFDSLQDDHIRFIGAQHIFFTGTAAPTGKVNISPKGMDSLRVLSPTRILWRNLTGSGNETDGHLKLANRITLMWCSFTTRPIILRAYGTASVTHVDDMGAAEAGAGVWDTILMPEIDPFLAPILYAVPAQLLAYHTAIAKGTDVDQPRNLAKSVTVE